MNLVHIGSEEEAVRQTLGPYNPDTQRKPCLPHEILASVFIDCARDYYYGHPGCPIHIVPRWVNVSYVCRYWRDVALSCPSLWTYLFLISQRWTEEILVRSKQASLKVHARLLYSYDIPMWSNLVEKVMDHTERIQELRLELPASCTHRILSKLSSRAPRLRNLEISFQGAPDLEWSSVLFYSNTPPLCTLELSCCPVPWYSFKLGALTTLSLHRIPVPFQKSMEEFLSTLSCMQDLRYLYLNRSLASAAGFLSGMAFNTFQKIILPHLSRFSVVAPTSTVIALLTCIDISLKTEVRLGCLPEPRSSLGDYAQLPSLLARRFIVSKHQTLYSPEIYSFSVDSTRRGTTLTFSVFDGDCDFFFSISHGEWDCGIPLKINIDWARTVTGSNRDRIISNICCAMPLTSVQTVHVIGPSFSQAFWRQTFGDLQDLRRIKLSCGYMPNLAPELSLVAHEEEESGHAAAYRIRGQVFAPRLEELELYWITFSQTRGNLRAPEPAISHQCLLDALATRKGPRGRLSMTRCRIGSEWFDSLVLWGDGNIYEVDENDSPASEEGVPSDG